MKSEKNPSKVKDFILFTKFRLSFLVVLSALITYAYAANEIDWLKLFVLCLGGFLVTGSSNGFNQIIERETDILMARTQNRPLPQNRYTLAQSFTISIAMGLIGIILLALFINLLSGILGLLALLSYTLLYTPMKKVSPLAVFVGAFPGAIPPLLGWVAATGVMDIKALIVFGIQFLWQFPHFWSLAWRLDDDYQKAGFRMLPSLGGKDKKSAFQILVYSFAMIPMGLFPYYFKMSGIVSAVGVTAASIGFFIIALKLYQSCKDEDASKLMFASFVYLPLVQILLWLDKI